MRDAHVAPAPQLARRSAHRSASAALHRVMSTAQKRLVEPLTATSRECQPGIVTRSPLDTGHVEARI
jgi:hypothetical protein